MRVLHVLESSIPDTGGYTIRARAIIDFQRRLGLEPIVVTSPLFPTNDRSSRVEEFDGIRYYRTNNIASPRAATSKLGAWTTRTTMLARYRRAVLEIAARERADVLHAHSSYTNAYAAMPAARQLNLPLVYEVRTLWGEAAVVEDKLSPWKQRLIWRFELGAMRRADLIVPIAEGIRTALVDRGIAPSKIAVVPNGVDTSEFTPQPKDETRARQVGLAGKFIVGFIGSIRRLEGLSTLLEALKICETRRRGAIGAVVVGEGPDRAHLEAQSARLGLTDIVFTGNVPHIEVASWYSTMDVVVYPRIRAVINERVTPLKPLEAMALGKVCVASDVGGLTELVRDAQTGVVFRADDPHDLAKALLELMDDSERMARLRQAALEFVRAERDWRSIVPRYIELYERVVREKGK